MQLLVRLSPIAHRSDCDCAAHRPRVRLAAPLPDTAPPDPAAAPAQVASEPIVPPDERLARWAGWLPILACLVCPACMSTYAKLLAMFGVGFGITEAQHDVLLALAIATSIAVSAWRSWRSGRAWPITVALVGSALLVLGHVHAPLHLLEYAGLVVILVGGVGEQLRLRVAGRGAASARSAAATELGQPC
jgi:hypothetical protein